MCSALRQKSGNIERERERKVKRDFYNSDNQGGGGDDGRLIE
jgi:hypothetical protein